MPARMPAWQAECLLHKTYFALSVPPVTSNGIGREQTISSPSSLRRRPLTYRSYRAGSVAFVVVTAKVPVIAFMSDFISIMRRSFAPLTSTLTCAGGVPRRIVHLYAYSYRT